MYILLQLIIVRMIRIRNYWLITRGTRTTKFYMKRLDFFFFLRRALLNFDYINICIHFLNIIIMKKKKIGLYIQYILDLIYFRRKKKVELLHSWKWEIPIQWLFLISTNIIWRICVLCGSFFKLETFSF